MCVCMYVCICVRACVCVCACVCILICTNECAHHQAAELWVEGLSHGLGLKEFATKLDLRFMHFQF